MAEVCMVFFRRGDSSLAKAEEALRRHHLEVARVDEGLVASYPDAPSFRICLSTQPHVAVEAAEIGRGTEHADAMAAFDARFEIAFEDLEDALDEINTPMEVQAALQEASGGYLFLSWNGNIVEQWRSEVRE